PGGVRDSAERQTSSNNLKQIGLALHVYNDSSGHFPTPYLKTKTGQPGLSWRVAILPHVEQDALYRQFKLDEPWDSPNNIRLLNQMPKTYMVPGQPDPTVTHYLAFVGPNTIFDPKRKGVRFAEVKDGLSNTITVVEAANPVPWTKPDDLTFPPNGPIAPLLKWRGRNALILLGDG